MSRRDLIKMSEDEVDAFLRERLTMSVATIGPSGHPHVVAMWYGFLDGAPAFWTYSRSQKVRNLERDPRLTAMVERGAAYEELQGVELIGRGTIITDDDARLTVGRSVMERYRGTANDDLIAAMGAKRVVVRIDVDKAVTWDHRKLQGRY